jgi:hypothetical protein
MATSTITREQAEAQGYTREVLLESNGSEYTIEALIQADADFDTTVRVYDLDRYKFVDLNGWLWGVEG